MHRAIVLPTYGGDPWLSVRGELWLGLNYAALGPYTTLFPQLHDVTATKLEDRHGRTNLILENKFVKKYKGTWTYGEGGYFDIVIGVEGKRWADEALNGSLQS